MADVPERIWACPIYSADLDITSWDDGVCGTYQENCEDEHAFILATPEALAAAPEVQALIRAAKAEGMREAAEIIERAKVEDQEAGITWGADPYVCDLFGHHIRAAAASAERG